MSERGLGFGRERIVKGRGLYVRLPLAERLRAARGMKQAIVKVRSFAHGMKGVRKLMDYISREGKLPLETESGTFINGREEIGELVRDWAIDFDKRKDSRDSAHIIFSMPPGSDPEALRRSIRTVGAKAFPGHEWVFAIHQDKNHPHAHMVLKMRSREQDLKLDFKKADLHRLREIFAQAAREQGIHLAASPRAARGVGRKALRHSFYYLRSKGIKPDMEKKEFDEAGRELLRGDWSAKPWEKAMAERNELERKAYWQEAAALREAAAKQTIETERDRLWQEARLLEGFAQSMPTPKSRRQALKERIMRGIEKQRQEENRAKEREEEHER